MGNMKNKDKYSLDKLRVSVTYEIVGIAYIKIYHGINRVYYKGYDVEEFALRLITDFMKWLEEDDGEEYKPQILTDKEKAYLSAVIKPFREKVGHVKKIDCGKKEFLKIYLEDDNIPFPFFTKGTMYKGMECEKEYTLEELGL